MIFSDWFSFSSKLFASKNGYRSFHLYFCKRFLIFFTDINECSTATHNCHADADCTNVKGSFNCTCKHGYEGSGRYCEGLLELKIVLAVFISLQS